MEKRYSFQQIVLEQFNIYRKKKNLNTEFTFCLKSNSKNMIQLYVKPKTINLLEKTKEKIYVTFS